ncbi:MAG: ATP-binding protein [Sphaerochaetaceae bacterium]|nr:ATP-binding protein [Sphaerochaetaceae bacterium]
MTNVERLLRAKAEGKEDYLITSFSLVKDTISKRLASISQVYPHYSLHDATHSESILENIYRLLGNDVLQMFSCIDLWLLGCSAYLHDSGMYVSGEEIRDIISSSEFMLYVEKSKEKRPAIKKYADRFEIKDNKVFYKEMPLDSAGYIAARILLADYVRNSHALRSKSFILKSSLISYQNIIPLRILNILGEICKSHNEAFDFVMNLPSIELGINSDYCHPRYISCLLRIGDLLDIDNNRFYSELFFSSPEVPEDSFLHYEKHVGIKHFFISREAIEITANCESYETAEVIDSWFSWIKKEIEEQSSRWNRITPSQDYGILPQANSFNINLEGFDKFEDKNSIPVFEMDSKKSLELLQGSGLYAEPHQCIRELLQNAADALTYRLWIDHKKEIEKFQEPSDLLKSSLYDLYTINITTDCMPAENLNVWTINISDNGIGMDKEDISCLIHPGKENALKKKIYEEMPNWFRPSGCFGIGFQSIFLITDEVKITTRKINSNRKYTLNLFNPMKEKKGTVLIKSEEINDVYDQTIGTTVSFSFTAEKIPKAYSYSYNQRETAKEINFFDFVEKDSLDIGISKIKDEIGFFSRLSLFPIEYNDISYKNFRGESHNNWYYCKSTGLEIMILKRNDFFALDRSSVFFKGQEVKDASINWAFLPMLINIVGLEASEVLTINRNKIRSSFNSCFAEAIMDTLKSYIREETINDKDIKFQISAFLKVTKLPKERIDFSKNPDIVDYWSNKEFFVSPKGEKQTIDSLTNNHSEIIFIRENDRSFELKENEGSLIVRYDMRHDKEVLLLGLAFYDKNYSPQYRCYNNSPAVRMAKDQEGEYVDSYAYWFSSVHQYAFRSVMPCNAKYNDLAINVEKLGHRGVVCYDATFSPFNFRYPVMICPFTYNFDVNKNQDIKIEITNELIDFVFELKEGEVSRERIKQKYEELKKDLEGCK